MKRYQVNCGRGAWIVQAQNKEHALNIALSWAFSFRGAVLTVWEA